MISFEKVAIQFSIGGRSWKASQKSLESGSYCDLLLRCLVCALIKEFTSNVVRCALVSPVVLPNYCVCDLSFSASIITTSFDHVK